MGGWRGVAWVEECLRTAGPKDEPNQQSTDRKEDDEQAPQDDGTISAAAAAHLALWKGEGRRRGGWVL